MGPGQGRSAGGGWVRVLRWPHLTLVAVVAVTLAAHFVTISLNPEPIFDEPAYIEAARSIIADTGDTNPEHPPLGKVIIAGGIELFGDNPFGWRFFPAVFGAAGVVLFYFICRRLLDERAADLATFLFALEEMGFVISGLAVLDAFMLTLMMAAFLLYIDGRYLLSGTALGLAALAKLTGGLALVAVMLHWLAARRDRPFRFALSVVLVPVSFLVFLVPLDYMVTGGVENPFRHVVNMLDWSRSMTFASRFDPSASRPWEWLVTRQSLPLGATVSVTVWALIIPAVAYLVWRTLRGGQAAGFAMAWFGGVYIAWIPLSLLIDRISYPYYLYPAIGAVCIGIAVGLERLLRVTSRRLRVVVLVVVAGYLAAHLVVFLASSGVLRL